MSEERLKEIHRLFQDLKTELEPALKDGDWRIEAGNSFRVYQAHWYGGLVHFESWVTNADIERQSLPVAFHFEAPKEKTGFKRTDFNELVIATAGPAMGNWEGYKLSPKSDQTFIRKVPFSEHLLADMKSEYCRVTALAPIINQAITDLRAK